MHAWLSLAVLKKKLNKSFVTISITKLLIGLKVGPSYEAMTISLWSIRMKGGRDPREQLRKN